MPFTKAVSVKCCQGLVTCTAIFMVTFYSPSHKQVGENVVAGLFIKNIEHKTDRCPAALFPYHKGTQSTFSWTIN